MVACEVFLCPSGQKLQLRYYAYFMLAIVVFGNDDANERHSYWHAPHFSVVTASRVPPDFCNLHVRHVFHDTVRGLSTINGLCNELRNFPRQHPRGLPGSETEDTAH